MIIPEIVLRPDLNRPKLESLEAKSQAEGIFEDSRQKVWDPSTQGEAPRVLLIVPPYTRMQRPLEIILDNIERDCIGRDRKDHARLNHDRHMVDDLRNAGVNQLQEMKRAGIPLGLLRAGTAAKKAGYDVRILDCVCEGFDHEQLSFTTTQGSTMISYGLPRSDIEKRIREFRPHVVGISIDYTHQWANARAMADIVKLNDPKTLVVMGGTHAHGLPGDALFDSPTDYVVRGQGDLTFPELLDSLTGRSKKPIREIEGIAYRENRDLIQTKNRAFITGLDLIAIPDLSLIKMGLYGRRFHSAGQRRVDHGHLISGFTSAGCDTRCTFCAIPQVQGPWGSMKEKKLDDYLQEITRQGVTEFIAEDDHMLNDPEWAMTVCTKLKEYRLPWVEEGGLGLFNLIALLPDVDASQILQSVKNDSVFNRTLNSKQRGLTAEKLIRAMAESGCYSAYLAVETANSEFLGTSNKPTLNALESNTLEIVSLFRKYGIKITCGLMIGFLDAYNGTKIESMEQISKSIEYGKVLKRAGADYINPFIFTPLPGAPHFSSLIPYVIRNTDEGFSHEFGTMNAPDLEWTRDEMSLIRAHAILEINGLDCFKQILDTGTWPI